MTKAKKKKPSNGWLFPLLAIPLIGCAIVLAFSAAILSHAGEYLPADTIIDKITASNGVYGPALSPRILAFKQRLYERYTPDTVVVGSTRVDQIRAEDFSVPFLNLSGAETLDEAVRLCETLFAKLKPKVVILALDDWWFLGDGKAAVTPRQPEAEKPGARDLFLLAGWYATGDLTFNDVRTILGGTSPNIGINGILHGDGFDKGGSYFYDAISGGLKPSPDKVFEASLDAVAHGDGIFGWGSNIAPEQWQTFNSLLDFLQKSNIKTIILLPPLAPTVLDTIGVSDKFGYVDGLRMKISETAAAFNMPIFDDHDLRFAGSDDCEFIDGAHPGAIAAKRMLLDMAVKNADMRTRLKLPEIGWSIAHFKERASTLAEEADFLMLGCKKTASTAPAPSAPH